MKPTLHKLFCIYLALFCSTQASADALDIAVIGDDFISQDNFRTDAEKVAANFITYDPYSLYKDKIRFTLVPNQDDLYCKPSSYMSRLVTCNGSVVYNKLNSLGIAYDRVIVLWNSPNHYGGSGGSLAVAYNGYYMCPMVVHEFSHGLGLVDEYVLYATSLPVTSTAFANCWKGIKAGWYKGCYASNYYRQTSSSIMKSLSSRYFNQVSKDILKKYLEVYCK